MMRKIWKAEVKKYKLSKWNIFFAHPLIDGNHHPPPPPTHPPQTQNDMIETKESNILKTKVVSLYKKTPKRFLNPTPTPKIAH